MFTGNKQDAVLSYFRNRVNGEPVFSEWINLYCVRHTLGIDGVHEVVFHYAGMLIVQSHRNIRFRRFAVYVEQINLRCGVI